ncbi:MAG: site-specific integrase [Bacteroidales bacterium]|jgi:integrase|nr:site-specific integrase [Bacteroidales bacterium]
MNNTQQTNTCIAAQFIRELAVNSRRSKKYRDKYKCLSSVLMKFEKKYDIVILSNSFNINICEKFIDFLRDRNLRQNSIRGYRARLLAVFNRMCRAGFDVDFSFKDIKIDKEEATSVYLRESELDSLMRLNIQRKNQCIIRDLFLVGCYTGLRYSDFTNLNRKNIIGNKIAIKTRKTGEAVEIPIHPIVASIIEKYDGFPRYERTSSAFNKIIRVLCKRAGITDNILTEYTRGHRVERHTTPKYAMVGSHTARRSFATNAYLAGIKPCQIMLMTGHKSESSFFSYIRIGKSENADTLAEHDFFRGDTHERKLSTLRRGINFFSSLLRRSY